MDQNRTAPQRTGATRNLGLLIITSSVATFLIGLQLYGRSPRLGGAVMVVGVAGFAVSWMLLIQRIARGSEQPSTGVKQRRSNVVAPMTVGWLSASVASWALGSLDPLITASIFMLMVYVLAFVLTGVSRAAFEEVVGAMMWAFAVSVALSVLLYFKFTADTGLEYLPGGDARGFDLGGRAVASAWENGLPSPLTGPAATHHFFYHLLGGIYFVGSEFGMNLSSLAVRFANPLILAATIPAIYHIAVTLQVSALQRARIIWSVALFPMLIAFTAVTLRETLLAFLVTWAAAIVILGAQRKIATLSSSLALVALMVVMFATRRPTAAAVLTVVAVFVVIRLGESASRDRSFRALFVMAVLIGTGGLVLAGLVEVWVDQLTRIPELTDRSYQRSLVESSTDSVGVRVLALPAPLRLILGLPLVPLLPAIPWASWVQPSGGMDIFRIIYGFGSLSLVLLAPSLVFGALSIVRRRDSSGVFIALVVLAIMSGAVMTSFDARHDVQVLPLVMVIAGLGWDRAEASRHSNAILIASTVVLGLAYLYLRLLL
jgi:hypothetical protein